MNTEEEIEIRDQDVLKAVRSKRVILKTGKLRPGGSLWMSDDEAKLIHAVRMALYTYFHEIDFDKICKGDKDEELLLFSRLYEQVYRCRYYKSSRVPSAKTLHERWDKYGTYEQLQGIIKRTLSRYQEGMSALRQSNKPADEINKDACKLLFERDRDLTAIWQLRYVDERQEELKWEKARIAVIRSTKRREAEYKAMKARDARMIKKARAKAAKRARMRARARAKKAKEAKKAKKSQESQESKEIQKSQKSSKSPKQKLM